MSKFHRLGATGNFPLGKLNRDDEGELTMAVGVEAGNVRIEFGKEVKWLALPPKQAIELASAIIEKAQTIKGPWT